MFFFTFKQIEHKDQKVSTTQEITNTDTTQIVLFKYSICSFRVTENKENYKNTQL